MPGGVGTGRSGVGRETFRMGVDHRFHRGRHPRQMGPEAVTAFLNECSGRRARLTASSRGSTPSFCRGTASRSLDTHRHPRLRVTTLPEGTNGRKLP